MNPLPAFRPVLACLLAAALLLAGCGGGGGDGTAPTAPPSATYGASSSYAGICTVETQKQFVRAYLDEVYLWYNEIPQVDASKYGTIPAYFHALLVTSPDATGQPRDRFSTVLPTSSLQAVLAQSYAPAAATPATSLLAAQTNAVPVVKTVTSTAGRRTGYIQFNDHAQGSQDDLIAAFRQIRDAGAQDLVLDLRYNSGGYLYIALAAASMVTGPASEGKTFESLRYNDKRTAESASSTLSFSSKVQFAESQNPRGTDLPQLALPRLYVLTSSQTCSASESIINSLRGVDVNVILVGQTTCGKPYGFTRKDNCGLAYFPIEFQGTNAKGEGNYVNGFLPTCNVTDNAATAAGGAADPLLNAALYHIDNNACPPGTTGLLRSAQPDAATLAPARPAWAGRLLRD